MTTLGVAGTTSLGWYGRLTKQGRRTFWASMGGSSLDNFDFSLFNFLIPTLTVVWGMSLASAGLMASSATVSGAVGGVIAGMLADRFGRVRILQITVLWFSVCTFLCGFAQNVEQMLIFRTLQGLGFGGELAVGAVLMGEAANPADRGRILGAVAGGFAIGAMAASLTYGALFLSMPAAAAWRWTFWVGIIPAVFVVYIRRNIRDPEVFVRPASGGALNGLARLFSHGLAARTILAVLLVAACTAASLTFGVWLPTWLRLARGLSVAHTTAATMTTYVGLLIGFLSGGYFIDLLGRRNAFRIFAVLSAILVGSYLVLPLPDPVMVILGGFVGVVLIVTGVGMTPYLTELFPTEVRGTGLGLCYSVGRAIGGASSNAIVGFASQNAPLGTVIASVVGVNLLLVIVAASLLPETVGLEFDARTAPAPDRDAAV